MEIQINPNGETTLAEQIRQQISWLIATGKLQANDTLPSVRILAKQLAVNLHTVRSGYRKLEEAGLVEIRQGSVTRVLPYDFTRIAQRVAQLRTHTVGVILPSINNPFYHKILQGIEEISSANDTLLFVSSTHDNEEEAMRIFSQFVVKGVDGVIVISHDGFDISMDDLVGARPLPVVTIDMPGIKGYLVNMDLEQAGYLATRHLIDLGHASVLFLAPNMLEVPNLQAIYMGYQRALREKTSTLTPENLVLIDGWGIAAGKAGGRELLKRKKLPRAIFAATDTIAIGCMQVLQQAGVRFPEDAALVGFNDIPLAELVQPALTTVVAPAVEMGRKGMTMLQSLILGKLPARQHIILPVELIVRESCGALRD